MTSIVVNLAGSILGDNDGGVWTKYGWSLIESPFDAVSTKPPLDSLGYWVLDLTKLGEYDAPYINVGQADLPIWLADSDKKIIGSPAFVSSTKKKIPVSLSKGVITCGSASLTTTSQTAFLVVPMAYVTATTQANKNAYLEMLGSTNSTPRKKLINDWSAFWLALLLTLIVMVGLSVILGILGFGAHFVKSIVVL